MQIQQANKEKEPQYRLIVERGPPKRREFVIEVRLAGAAGIFWKKKMLWNAAYVQVQVGERTSQGVGPNKKIAKRTASENMLELMGFSKPSPQPSKPAIKTESQTANKKVHFSDQDTAQAGSKTS